MKTKRMIIVLLTLLFATTSMLHAQKPQLVVWQKNGQKVYYELAEQPVTTFENGLLVIKTSMATVEYQLENMLRYTYEGVKSTGIEAMEETGGVKVKQTENELTISQLKKETEVRLFDANGRLLKATMSDGYNPVIISLSTLPSGLYIIKTDSQTIKIMKR